MNLISSLLAVIPMLLLMTGCANENPLQDQSQAKAIAASVKSNGRIEVLDFHTTHRCKTCLTIEKYTRELLAESYGREMKEGLISFQLIDVDDEANEEIVKKYLAFGTTLIINTVSEGDESHIDLTNFAFMNADSEAKFKAGLKEQLEASLKKIKS